MNDPCDPGEQRHSTGFSLLELMMVLTLILLAARFDFAQGPER